VGSRPNTVTLARQYDATDIVDYKKGGIIDQVLALTGGQRADRLHLCDDLFWSFKEQLSST
jgi:hypothetical protein